VVSKAWLGVARRVDGIAGDGARRALPEHPSPQASQASARGRGVLLAVAQHLLSAEYGFADWAALMASVIAYLQKRMKGQESS
jgi:hypothetical protein